MWIITTIGILGFFAAFYGVAALIGRLFTIPEYADSDRYGNRILTGQKKLQLPFAGLSIIVGVILFFLSLVVIQVGPQEVGVLATPSGVHDNELKTGWHMVWPWNTVYMMDKTVWVYTCAKAKEEGAKSNEDAIWAATGDGIRMGFDVSVSWHINPEEASWIYQNVTANDDQRTGRYIWLEENQIRAKLKSAVAIIVSKYTPIEVYSTKRQEIQEGIQARIAKEIAAYRIIIDQVDMREVYYNPEYEKSIDAKKLAEQEALRLIEVTKQKNEQLKQAEINKNIAIQQAEGEAKALQIKGNAIIQNPKIIQLQWIEKWDGALPKYMMGNGQGVILNLPNQ